MQRANGDWFAISQGQGSKGAGLRVPIFSSSREAAHARAFNAELLVFKPALIDERALTELTPAAGQLPTHFWLVDDACTNMKRGVALNLSELTKLIRDETK
jgi:hypothetical protein